MLSRFTDQPETSRRPLQSREIIFSVKVVHWSTVAEL